jgi:adenylate kinase
VTTERGASSTAGRAAPGGKARAGASAAPPRMKVYVVLGAPGAGKGTQGAMLSERLHIPLVSSGELFRHAVHDESRLGRMVKDYLERGALVPDDLTVRVVRRRLEQEDAHDGAILDGFPRTVPQAEALDALLAELGTSVCAALFISVPEPELLTRLSGRWLCRAEGHPYHEQTQPPRVPGVCDVDGSELYQREDDVPETIRARLAKQLPPMYEVADHYRDQGVLLAVDGAQPPERVSEDLLRCLREPGC